jgi:predicted NAD/FAD-binding protein
VRHGPLALDTGFLVHNGPNYPLLTRLFEELGVPVQQAQMSFSVSCGHCGLEWSGRRPFAQPRRAIDPRFVGLLREVVRWLRTASRSLDEADYEARTLEEYAADRGYSARFRSHYLVPLTSSLWSTAPERALDFPASYAIRFFERHGMLGFGRFRWRSVVGGAETYVQALLERFAGTLCLDVGVRSLSRDADGVTLRTEADEILRFDKVVVATHADQALRLLEDPSDAEDRLLGAWRSTRNEAVLHTDSRFLPRARAARASWNYQVNGSTEPHDHVLPQQPPAPGDGRRLVRLSTAPPRSAPIGSWTPPCSSIRCSPSRACERSPSSRACRGAAHLYAGAYHGYGFHEDGLSSGVRAAAALGVTW